MLDISGVLDSREKKRQFIITYIIFSFNGMLALSVGSIMPFMRDAKGFDYAFAGLLISVFSVGNLISNFLSGAIQFKIGKKKTALLFNSFFSIAYLLLIFGRGNIVMVFAFLMIGLTRGSFTYFNNATINDIATGEAWAINGLHAMFSIGAFFFPLFVMFTTSGNSGRWIWACWFMVAIGIVSWILNFIMPEDNRSSKNHKSVGGQFGFVKVPMFWLAGGTMLFYLCAEQSVIGWLITYFKDSGLMSATLSQVMASVLWITILAGRLTVAYLSTRVNREKLYIAMGTGFVIFFTMLILSRNTIMIIIGIVGFGFSMSGIYPTTVAFAGDIIKEYPLSWTFMLTIGGIGSIAMPYIIGKISETSGIILGMSSIVVVIVLDMIFMMMLLFERRKTSNVQTS